MNKPIKERVDDAIERIGKLTPEEFEGELIDIVGVQPMNENNISEIVEYFNMRVEQMGEGYHLKSTELVEADGAVWGVRALVKSSVGNVYQSVFVREDFRGKGLMKQFARENVKATGIPFWTANECDIADWFSHNKIPFLLVPLTV